MGRRGALRSRARILQHGRCSSGSPCENFYRTTATPSWSSLSRTLRSQLTRADGATILVRRIPRESIGPRVGRPPPSTSSHRPFISSRRASPSRVPLLRHGPEVAREHAHQAVGLALLLQELRERPHSSGPIRTQRGPAHPHLPAVTRQHTGPSRPGPAPGRVPGRPAARSVSTSTA